MEGPHQDYIHARVKQLAAGLSGSQLRIPDASTEAFDVIGDQRTTRPRPNAQISVQRPNGDPVSVYWRRAAAAPADGRRRGGGPRSGALTGAPTDAVVVGRFLSTVIVTLHGEIDRSTAGGLASTLHDLVDGQGNLSVVVDLRDVGHLDPLAVEALISSADRIEGRGGSLRLGNPVGEVFDSLALAGMARLIDLPFERERRARPPDRSGGRAARQASIDSHPAGKARYDREALGGAP